MWNVKYITKINIYIVSFSLFCYQNFKLLKICYQGIKLFKTSHCFSCSFSKQIFKALFLSDGTQCLIIYICFGNCQRHSIFYLYYHSPIPENLMHIAWSMENMVTNNIVTKWVNKKTSYPIDINQNWKFSILLAAVTMDSPYVGWTWCWD